MVHDIDRQLGDLIGPRAERLQGPPQVRVGLLDLACKIGRQRAGVILAALPRDISHPRAAWDDHRRAVAVRRRIAQVGWVNNRQLVGLCDHRDLLSNVRVVVGVLVQLYFVVHCTIGEHGTSRCSSVQVFCRTLYDCCPLPNAKMKMATKRKPKAAPPAEAQDAALSEARIAAAAVTLLDAHGIDGLTMRKLAAHLDAGVMSLYWHVKNKDDLLALALDAVLEYRAPDRADAAPQAQLLGLLEDWRAVMLAHPWSAALLPSRALGPSILERLEHLGRILSSAGVADEDLNAAIWSLWNYVMGATITRTSFNLPPSPPDQGSPQHPHATIDRAGLLAEDDWDGVFRRGVSFLWDGIIAAQPASNLKEA